MTNGLVFPLNPNPSINSKNDNAISPKITKIMRKSHSKFNV